MAYNKNLKAGDLGYIPNYGEQFFAGNNSYAKNMTPEDFASLNPTQQAEYTKAKGDFLALSPEQQDIYDSNKGSATPSNTTYLYAGAPKHEEGPGADFTIADGIITDNSTGKTISREEYEAKKGINKNSNDSSNINKNSNNVDDADIDIPSNKFSTKTGKPNPAYDPKAVPVSTGQNQPIAFAGNLQQGQKSADVSTLQGLLGITQDGSFGPKTLAAVKAFQASHGLTVDGIVGPKTLAAFNASKSGPTAKDNVESGAGRGGEVLGASSDNNIPGTKIPSTGNSSIDSLISAFENQSPQKSFSDVYKEAYTSLGLDTMKKDYEKQTKAFSDLQNEKNEEAQKINNDPWFSEGVRVQKLQQLDKKYEGKETILTNKLKILESNIANGRADAQFIAGKTMEELQQSHKLTEDLIMKAIDISEKESSASGGPASVQEYEYAVSQGYDGSFSDYQNEDANRKISIAKAGAGGLTPGQVNTTINSISSAFDNEAIVKNYNTTQEGYQTIKSIGIDTKSPADDIAFIYAFAKIMDPNSVVREGEYNTIQKYAQTWADNFAFSAKRIFSNTNFLTADAKQKMLNALKPKVDTIGNQYKNLRSEYQRQIDDAYAGKPRQITNYSVDNNIPPGSGSSTPIPKGTLTGAQYVEKVLSAQGINYNNLVSQIPKGQIGVINNQTGEIGLVPESEANSSVYTRIN